VEQRAKNLRRLREVLLLTAEPEQQTVRVGVVQGHSEQAVVKAEGLAVHVDACAGIRVAVQVRQIQGARVDPGAIVLAGVLRVTE
jgi:hypothetical protein